MSQLPLPDEFPFVDDLLPYRIEPMRTDDIKQVMHIERVSFPAPWPATAYRYDLTKNDLATYLVLRLMRPRRAPLLLGYGGFWLMVDEAHISTIAVHPQWRGRGLGAMLLLALAEVALRRGAERLTLEVRESNTKAQNLYRKYAFAVVGRRRRYYHDNDEDALIMTTPRLRPTDLAQFKAALRARLLSNIPWEERGYEP